MTVVVVTPPAGLLVALATAKAHLRVEHDDHDGLIEGFIQSCAEWLDGPSGILGLALGEQTLMREGPLGIGSLGTELECGPVTSIESITWHDGAEDQTVDPALYELVANQVRLVAGARYPFGWRDPSVRVTYAAGYGGAQLPANIRAAILLHLKILYDEPEDKALAALERSRDALLAPIRRRRV